MSNLSAILSRRSFFNFVSRIRCVYCMDTCFCTVYFAAFHHMLFTFVLFLVLLLSLSLPYCRHIYSTWNQRMWAVVLKAKQWQRRTLCIISSGCYSDNRKIISSMSWTVKSVAWYSHLFGAQCLSCLPDNSNVWN